MPVVVASATRSADALISYALDDKADQQGERYVMASGVGGLLVSVAKQQMRDVRKKWGKDKPGAFVHAYHVIESFAKDELDPDDPDSWMTAQRLGRALAEDRFPGRHALIVTQRDGKTGCLHNHIVVNSIETKTGKSLDSSIVMHSRLVEAHERVLEAEGFEQRADLKQAFADATDRRERGEPSGLRRAGSSEQSELREFQRHIMWDVENDIADELDVGRNTEPFSLTVLKSRIEQTLTDPAATDWTSFVEVGRRHGVHIEQRGKKGRGISYGMLRQQPGGTLAEPSASDRRRCSSLGASFEMDAVERALARNSAAQQPQALVSPVVATRIQLPSAAAQNRPAKRKPSAKERLEAALREVDGEASVDYMTDSTVVPEPQSSNEAPAPAERIATAPVPRGTTLSRLREAEAMAAAKRIPRINRKPGAAETNSKAQTADEGVEKLRRINRRNRRLDLPPISPEEHAANQTMTPEQRKRRQENPEWFDDTTQATKPSKQVRVLGD